MSINTLTFLLTAIKHFEANALSVWVFGGWAEELWQIAQPRTHTDIDFLYLATNFDYLDRFISQMGDIQEIQGKHFSHKRGIPYQHVMVEFFLVRNENGIYFTDFFSGKYRLEWPADVFSHRVNISGYDIQIASKQALTTYRQRHKQIEQSYEAFLMDSEKRIVSEP